MLSRLNRTVSFKFAIEKKLFIYDSDHFDGRQNSGIKGTIFGATGTVTTT
jgi:hypothetical protein